MIEQMKNPRLHLVDEYRGFWIINMILYHGIWDLVYIYRVDWSWFRSTGAEIWQEMGCWSFIFIAGFCWQMSRRNLKRGLLVYGAGVLISAVTLLLMYQSRVVFGVLTLLGSSMLLMIPLDLILRKVKPLLGAIISFLLFHFTYTANRGYFGFGKLQLVVLPDAWNEGFFSNYLGFTAAGFYSSDYFPIFPWIFMFIVGYFTYSFVFRDGKKIGEKIQTILQKSICKPLGWVGRHSLIIYMLHQPVVYGALYIVDLLFGI